MKTLSLIVLLSAAALFTQAQDQGRRGVVEKIPNPNIDMKGYLAVSQEAAEHRATHRVTEADFLKMAAEKGTVILDARSHRFFEMMHIDGAVNLPFPDITVESLAKQFPDKETRILIYCNNNIKNATLAFPSKLPTASLNLSTYIALFNYGYKNVYELGPVIDPKDSKIKFAGTAAK